MTNTCYINGCGRPRATKKDWLCVAHKHRLVEHGAVLPDIPIGGATQRLRRIAFERYDASPVGQGLQPLDAQLLDGVELVFTGTDTPEGIYAAGPPDRFEWWVWSGTAASRPRLIGPFHRLRDAQEFYAQRIGLGYRYHMSRHQMLVLDRLPRYHPDVSASLLEQGVYVDPAIPDVYIAVMLGLPDFHGRRRRVAIATNDRRLAEHLAGTAPEDMEAKVEVVRERDRAVACLASSDRRYREDMLDAYRELFGEDHPGEATGEALSYDELQLIADASVALRGRVQP